MRLFSIVQWYHFAYMVISIALLGFAASGTLLALIQSRGKGVVSEAQCILLFSLTSFLLFLFTAASFCIAQTIPFSPFELVWQKRQFLYLAGYYGLFFIPFFLAGCFIGLSFMRFREQIGRVYFFNLLGSGVGVVIALISFYVVPPALLLIVPSFFALLGFFFSVPKKMRTKRYLVLNLVGLVLVLAYLMKGGITLEISPYKGISKGLQLPDAQLEYEEYSPLGLVQVVDAPSLRYAPGLSLTYAQGPPPQKELFIDGNSYGAVTNFKGDKDAIAYLDHSTFSLAYHVISPQEVLVLDPGGGSQILAALFHSADHIQAVEPQPTIVNLLRGPLRSFSHHIYDYHPHIQVDIASPREFMARDVRTYDLIQLDVIGSWGGVGGGIYATGENYTYTVEAFQEYFAHLKPQGILSASAWLSSPPRSFLKLMALAAETLDKDGERDISRSMVAIRSWATGTVLIKKGEFSFEEGVRIRNFCKERAFDLVYLPGIERGDVNHYSVLESPIYYESVESLLRRNTRHEFYENYLFNIRPPTDDKPYFFHFFRLSALVYLLKTLGREWIPFLEWGSVILWGTLFQALIIAPLFILLPLVFIRGKGRLSRLGKGKIFLYFSLLGLAFMFVEMAFIQKLIVVLTHPIFALALVLFSLLFFSGIGSLLSNRVGEGRRWIPFAGILFFSSVSVLCLDGLLKVFLPYSHFLKCLLLVFFLAPLGFFMGMPFPIGLQVVADRQRSYIPWVWGVNGVASVIAPVLGSLLSIWLGFRILMALSLLLYGVAGWMMHLISKNGVERE
ncbi:MAG: SAM-dependent methyltransferase [Proteobacteria bacterium]|nr:SAM-dependent methyltransferase [Pseudomonadota bacterium]